MFSFQDLSKQIDFSGLGFLFYLLELFNLRFFQKRHENSQDISICFVFSIKCAFFLKTSSSIYLFKKKRHFSFLSVKDIKMEEMKSVSVSHLFFVPRSNSACSYRRSPRSWAWSRAGDRALLVHGRRSHGRRGQRLGGGTALDALPKRSPAEAGGRRREGGRGRKTQLPNSTPETIQASSSLGS